MKLTRYWVELKDVPVSYSRFGVTAWSADDALSLIAEYLRHYYQQDRPLDVLRIVENVDVSTLDANHVLPNMLPPIHRSIWYPMG